MSAAAAELRQTRADEGHRRSALRRAVQRRAARPRGAELVAGFVPGRGRILYSAYNGTMPPRKNTASARNG